MLWRNRLYSPFFGQILRTFQFVLLALAFSLVLSESMLHAQSYSTGYKKYVKGDFAGAENAFRIALNKNQSDAEKARLYKMIGISQYMQGKRIAAETSFQQAKALNPYINISSSEVLDDSIIPFFNTIKAPPPKDGQRPAPTEVVTVLKIYANAPNASIAIDGVKLGAIGKPIKVTPGIHEVTVSAPGYQTESQPIDIKSGEANNLSVNLKKEVSKTETKVPEDLPEAQKTAPIPAPEPKKVTRDDAENAKKSKVKKSRKKVKITKNQGKKEVKKRKRKKKKSPSTGPSPVVNLMPLGIPQYMNQKTGLGVVFTSVQVGGFLYGILKYLESEKLLTETNDEISRRDEERAKITDPTQQQQDQADAFTYQEEQQEKIDKLFIQYWIGFGISGLGWAASSIEAFLSGPPPGSPARTSLHNPAPEDQTGPVLAGPVPFQDRRYETIWDVRLTPMHLPQHYRKPGMPATTVPGLSLHIKF